MGVGLREISISNRKENNRKERGKKGKERKALMARAEVLLKY